MGIVLLFRAKREDRMITFSWWKKAKIMNPLGKEVMRNGDT